MNLQETIRRVLREEINALGDAKVIEKINNHIVDEINEFKSKLPKSTIDIKIIDTTAVINNATVYLKSKIPTALQDMKSGKGGGVFVHDILTKLLTLVESELKKGFPDNLIGWGKKKSIQLLSPSKEKLKKILEESDEFDNYFQMFVDLVDFPFVIGMMDEVQPYLNKINAFDNQKNEYLKNNYKAIKYGIINKVINFIYS
jgi:hypothetical protein